MNGNQVFIDTNLLIYLVKDNTGKAEIVAKTLETSGNIYISTQVINEFCNVAIKKLGIPKSEILFSIAKFTEKFDVNQLSVNTINFALNIQEKYNFSYYDSLIISSALENNCSILYTEDMHHNQIIENSLTIINPFK
jgi:predicted nucleic acid-binding protein